jgi:uncharacterized protein (TIGR02646 family)
MRKITKSRPPNKLTSYKLKRNPQDSTYRPTYSDIDKDVYDDTLISLLNEQGWICGYCQQKITSIKASSIEHQCEHTICNGSNGRLNKTLDYKNMLAVCPGRIGKEQFCDTNKANFTVASGLPISISPWNQSHINRIKYSSSGLIKSTNSNHNDEIDRILNLNNKKILKNRRASKFAILLSNSGDPSVKRNKDKLKRLLERDLIFGNNKFSNSFPGMSEYMLKLFCS